ncbi:MAG: lasso peptide biosynthesis B2 protein [Rhizobacter sp.]|nr:lasso peptide biosynthesis B2 protein [Rhizobacter sp.]
MDAADETLPCPLRLADHVRACVLTDQVVLLDLRRSRYLSVPGDLWARLVKGDPPLPQGRQLLPIRLGTHNTEKLLRPLAKQNLLTRLPPVPVEDQPLPLATTSWEPSAANPTPPVGARRAWHLIGAAVWASRAIRTRSLQEIATQVTHARDPHPPAEAESSSRLDAAISAFHRLRPLLLTARDRCLHDSLTCVSFLAREGIAAHWVIGVKSQPFAAHAWVQMGSMVVNDLHDTVRHYEPILVA